MKAIVYDEFAGPLRVARVSDPRPASDGVVMEVRACGVCRSDWHGWQGHDADIQELPHVPGHELAGVVAEVGREVTAWHPGDRVTVPFVAGCGTCPECTAGNPQICDRQFQPGFTAWGAFAELVALRYADANLVRIPESLDFVTAASLGCRLSTAYRAVVLQGRVASGDWVSVHGCGGLGLAVVMVARAVGARVVGIDVRGAAISMAQKLGAERTLDATETTDIAAAVCAITGRGADVSFDTLGSPSTCASSICCLRKQGRHVQVGLLGGEDATPRVPMELVVARELELVGSHGLAAANYPDLMELVISGRIDPRQLVQQTISLEEVPQALSAMGQFEHTGMTVAAISSSHP